MNKRSLIGRVAAIVGAVALSMTAMVAPAHAADGDTNPTPTPTIDTSAPVSLTVHKHETNQDSTPGDVKGKPLEGVKFDVLQIEGIDLSDSAVNEAVSTGMFTYDAQAGTVTIAGTAYDLTSQGQKATATDGTATWGPDGLAQGLYLVVETDPGSNPIVQMAKPFLVALPYSNDGAWVYDADVYPKNSLGSVTKAIDEGASLVGKGIQYTVTAPIPNLPEGATAFESFTITDKLDSRLTFRTDPVATVTVGSAQLTAGDDYMLTSENGTVVVTLKASGLKTLADNQGKDVVLTFQVDVNNVGEDGIIDNTAVLNINGTDITSNTVTTKWGQLTIHKTDGTHDLTGAEFVLYTDEAGTNPVEGVDNPIRITNQDGTYTVPVLKPGTYYLKETKAPAGFVLDDAIKAVTVVAGPSNAEAKANYQTVVNTQQTGPMFPLTGAEGQRNLAIGGIAVLVLAAGSAVAVRGRKSRS